jgi:hypothetical protein
MKRFAFPFSLPFRRPFLPVLPTLARLPLPITALATAALLLVPAVSLSRLPRPRAQGLEQLMDDASLLQSFPATPQRPVPELWRERFGAPLATRLWRQQRRPWWQFWGAHADGPPFLAISTAGLLVSPSDRLPPTTIRVGDLLVVAPDALSRRLLADRLRPQQRRSRGLARRCLERLESGQAVFWNPQALAVIIGPVAPLFQPFQEGCFTLDLESAGLRWQGEAASIDGILGAAAPSPALLPSQLPLSPDLLLELEGASLEQLLQGLLARQMIRDPLESRYGLDTSRLALLRRAPFRLRLRPQPQGSFQASLELQLGVGKERRAWQQLLDRLAVSLQEQGLQEQSLQPNAAKAGIQAAKPSQAPEAGDPTLPPQPTPSQSTPAQPIPAKATPALRPMPSATWSRDDGVAVGGWRWITPANGESQLLFFLGPPPRPPLLPMGGFGTPLPATVDLRLRARPASLDDLGLLPPDMPELVRRSDQLWIEALPPFRGGAFQPISLLRGRLQLPLRPAR